MRFKDNESLSEMPYINIKITIFSAVFELTNDGEHP